MADDGGLAFPTLAKSWDGNIVPGGDTGMTLRDWFAGMALAGLTPREWSANAPLDPAAETIARNAYAVADAMLTARGGRGT